MSSLTFRIVSALSLLLWVGAPAWADDPAPIETAGPTSSCITCHEASELMVTNKKLYDYFQNWRASIHGQAGVSCVDCHGGRPEASGKEAAHGRTMGASSASSAVNFQNIPATCGNCHSDVFESYRTSKHFAHLEQAEESAQGPNCVTCHGSLSAQKVNVNTVRATCQNCHNTVSGNQPEIPQKSEMLLNELNAIRGARHFISLRARPEEELEVLANLDRQLETLASSWHTFELENIEAQTATLFAYAKENRDRILQERRTRKQEAKEESP